MALDRVFRDARDSAIILFELPAGNTTKGFQLRLVSASSATVLGHFHGDFLRNATMACVNEPYGVNQLGTHILFSRYPEAPALKARNACTSPP